MSGPTLQEHYKKLDPRPLIQIEPSELPRMVQEISEAVAGARVDMYQHGGRLVRVMTGVHKTFVGQTESLRLSQVHRGYLFVLFAEVARWERWSAEDEEWKPAPVPDRVVDAYLDMDGDWGLPHLLSVAMVPTMRRDGTLIETVGYDEATGIYYDPCGVKFPPVPMAPTREDALLAIEMIKRPLRKFKFVTPADKSVALSGVITAVIRPTLPVAPMHTFSSPVAGSGKGKLVDYAAIIATGRPASVTAAGHSPEELDKRLVASLLAGDQIIAIDNVDGALGSDLLCQMLTQTSLKPRVLGLSKNVEVPNTSMLFSNGNNIVLIGDMSRRVLRSDIDPEVVQPELIVYDFDPIDEARAARPELVVGVFTIIRAWLLHHGDAAREPPLGSYEEWSHFVRSALVWLGEADPVTTLDKVRASDPRLNDIIGVAEAWRKHIGEGWITLNSVVRLANGRTRVELTETMMAVASEGRDVGARKLSWWLRKNMGRRIALGDGGMYWFLMEKSGGKHSAKWCLACGKEPEGEAKLNTDNGEVTL